MSEVRELPVMSRVADQTQLSLQWRIDYSANKHRTGGRNRVGKREETSLGGPGREFPVTSWSVIAGVQNADPEVRRQALEGLCQRYWKPVYHFARRAWSKSSEDAKDLAQGFFLWLIESDPIRKYAAERGTFRAYLKSVLRNFSANQHDFEHALKRGGGAKVLAFDWGAAPLHEFLADESAPDPEGTFDLAWKKEVLDRAVERVREWFASSGRSLQFRAFEEYDLPGEAGKPTYSDVATRLGVKEGDVRNYLFEVRERIRTEIRTELAQTVSDAQQLEDEWAELFGA